MGSEYKERIYKGMAGDILKYLPLSMLNISRNEKLYSIIKDDDKPVIANHEKTENYEYAELHYTEFSPDLTEFVYDFYLNDYPDACIYDPFAGRATRGIMAYILGYNYYGFDLDQAAIDNSKAQLSSLRKSRAIFNPDWIETQDIRFMYGDSTNFDILHTLKEESFDFAFTCPPFWQLERYSDDPRDLSNKQTYEEFLECITRSWMITYKLLKHRSFFCFVANYFRQEGKFYHLARDLIDIGVKQGFRQYDEIILQLKSARAIKTLSSAFQRFYSAKSHEYLMCLYKP